MDRQRAVGRLIEMENKKTLLSIIALVVIVALGAGLLFGINAYTAPIIEANKAGSAGKALLKVFPEGKDFSLLYTSEDPSASVLTGVPETVRTVHAETSGLGWVVSLSTTAGYTGEPMEIMVGVDAQGRIVSAEITAYPDTKDLGAEYPVSYVGQDSTLAGVTLVSGATYSSKAFRGAVEDAFAVLVGNNLMAAAEKGPEQKLTELVPLLHSGLVNPEGAVQAVELEVSDADIVKAMMAPEDNSTGGAFIVSQDGELYLALTNASGCVAAYDVEGDPVELSAGIADKVSEISLQNTVSHASASEKKLAKLLPEGSELTPVKLEGVFNSVAEAYTVSGGENTLYAFAAKEYGYSNMVMTFYYVLDAEGAITAMNADELILIKEYFSSYELDEDAYRQGFAGLTASGADGSETLITGATCSSNASAAALNDVFAAFAILNENGGFAA